VAFFAQANVSFFKNLIITLALEKKRHFCRKLANVAEIWQKSSKIGKYRRKLAKIVENWQKSPKIGKKNRRKLRS
jgi:hypothetical protein